MGKSGDMNKERVKILMRESAVNRRNWIEKDNPKVVNVLEDFPALADPSMVCFE